MRWTRFKRPATLIGMVFSIAIAAILFLLLQGWLGSPRAVTSPDGRVVRLDAWNFKTAPVPYDLPYHPWAKRLDKVLPNWLKQRLHLSPPVLSSVAMPNFRGEPFLSAAFSIHNVPDARQVGALRIIVSDDRGQEFDPAVQTTVTQERGTQYWANEVEAFPRRGRELRLHLVSETQTLAEIAIPNPAPGPHPRWKAEKLPVRAGDSGLEFSLVRFQSYQPGAATFTKVGLYPRTQCSFRIQENGRTTLAWRPVSFEISDATGNHWKAWWDSRLSGLNGDEITAGFLGALWPEEDAWKMRVEFKRVAEFPDDELVRMVKLPIPGSEEILHPQISCETNHAVVGIVAIIGAKAPWEKVVRFNPDRVGGCVTVLINGRIRSQGRRLVFIEAKDEFGNIVKLEGPASEPGQLSGQSPDYLPYSFNFRPGPNAHELTLLLAVSAQEVVEFLAKPDQVREGPAGLGN